MSSELETLAGGAQIPDGYTYVNSVSEDDDFSEDNSRFAFDDLQPMVKIENTLTGVSVSFQQRSQGSPVGEVDVRLIHDFKARVYLVRKDQDGVTYLRALIGHNVD